MDNHCTICRLVAHVRRVLFLTVVAVSVNANGLKSAFAQAGADLVVSKIIDTASYGRQDPSGTGDFISAFAVGATSCNVGTQDLDWFPGRRASQPPGGASNQHPAIHQAMYRLKDQRFEQIGLSWVKHGFYALNEEQDCAATCSRQQGGNILYMGCSDPYHATLNGSRAYLGPMWEINAHTGYFPATHTDSLSTTAIPNRLQIHESDIEAGSTYFVQVHYVHPDDTGPNAINNASYRQATVVWSPSHAQGPRYVLSLIGSTQLEEEGIRAWQDTDPTVTETDAPVPNEGLFILAAKAIDLGSGFWRYEYAVQNLNSDRCGASFTVPLPAGAIVENAGFHDVDYHDGDGVACQECECLGGANDGLPCGVPSDCPDGSCPDRGEVGCNVCTCTDGDNDGTPCVDPTDCFGGGRCGAGPHVNYDGTDWESTVLLGKIVWSTTPYDDDPNANALRWGTLYNFYFDANIGPANTSVTLGLFKPGLPSEITIATKGPGLTLIDCNENGIPDTCDLDCGAVGCTPPCGGSSDCSDNRVPDECETDCQPEGSPGHGIPDFCDIRDGTSGDCQPNTVPDECEPDCDGDGITDDCDTYDTDEDGIPDCDDLCPETTPEGACLPPYNQPVVCCFSNGIYSSLFTWGQCISFAGAMPVCDDPPQCPGTPCRETQCRDGCLLGDFDGDGDIDLVDISGMASCFSGATGNPAYVLPSEGCLTTFDFEPDGDIDLTDYESLWGAFTGP